MTKENNEEDIKNLIKSSSGIQNISAAMENLLLAAANMGYGECCMTASNYVAKEIEKSIGFEKEGYHLAAMTPLGIPEDSKPSRPPRKSLDDVLTIID